MGNCSCTVYTWYTSFFLAPQGNKLAASWVAPEAAGVASDKSASCLNESFGAQQTEAAANAESERRGAIGIDEAESVDIFPSPLPPLSPRRLMTKERTTRASLANAVASVTIAPPPRVGKEGGATASSRDAGVEHADRWVGGADSGLNEKRERGGKEHSASARHATAVAAETKLRVGAGAGARAERGGGGAYGVGSMYARETAAESFGMGYGYGAVDTASDAAYAAMIAESERYTAVAATKAKVGMAVASAAAANERRSTCPYGVSDPITDSSLESSAADQATLSLILTEYGSIEAYKAAERAVFSASRRRHQHRAEASTINNSLQASRTEARASSKSPVKFPRKWWDIADQVQKEEEPSPVMDDARTDPFAGGKSISVADRVSNRERWLKEVEEDKRRKHSGLHDAHGAMASGMDKEKLDAVEKAGVGWGVGRGREGVGGWGGGDLVGVTGERPRSCGVRAPSA